MIERASRRSVEQSLGQSPSWSKSMKKPSFSDFSSFFGFSESRGELGGLISFSCEPSTASSASSEVCSVELEISASSVVIVELFRIGVTSGV